MKDYQQAHREEVTEGNEVEIVSIGSKGDGIGKHNGKTVIVPDTKIGDKVGVVVTTEWKNILFAQKVSNKEKE